MQFFDNQINQPPDQQTDSTVVLSKTGSKHIVWKRKGDFQNIKQLALQFFVF